VSIPLDADVPIFLWAMVRIILGANKRARANPRALPVRPEYEEIPEDTLSQAQKDCIQPFDAQLAALHYRPVCTYRITNFRNYGHNLVRRYFHPLDSASCSLTILELKAKVNNLQACKTSSGVLFTTRFSDDTLLTTRNMPLKSLNDQPPYNTVQECRQVTDLAELKRRHDACASKMGIPVPPASDVKAIFEEQLREHQRFCAFQLQRGLYRLLPDGEAYALAEKARVRGIWNYFNPFARRISWPSLVFSALVGSLLPLSTIRILAPLLSQQLENLPGPTVSFASTVLIAGSYVLAGAIIGSMSEWAPYYGIMVISYFPAHLIAGWSFGWFPYSTAMFLVSFSVIQARRRRSLIFESTHEAG
jgi:hypothetical protein